MACASTTTRPKPSGEVEAETTTSQHVGRRHVPAFVHDLHGAAEAELGGMRLELAAVSPGAGAHEKAAHVGASELRHRLYQHELAFPARETPGHHHHRHAVG